MPVTDDSATQNLEEVLDRLDESAEGRDEVTLAVMLDTVGRRSFAPVLLLVGLIALSPLSGIPGMPTSIGLVVVLTAGQLLLGRSSFWVPGWILRRKVQGDRLRRGTRSLRRPARAIDRLLRPRLQFLTRHIGAYVIVVVCALIGATMPPLELLPFVATTAGAALTAFALALLANDGLFALFALAFTTGLVGLVVYMIL